MITCHCRIPHPSPWVRMWHRGAWWQLCHVCGWAIVPLAVRRQAMKRSV